MSSTSMLNEIIRGKAIYCCFRAIQKFVANGLCNAARDWEASCIIIIKRWHKWGEEPQMLQASTERSRDNGGPMCFNSG